MNNEGGKLCFIYSNYWTHCFLSGIVVVLLADLADRATAFII